jgi:hypothetical protein
MRIGFIPTQKLGYSFHVVVFAVFCRGSNTRQETLRVLVVSVVTFPPFLGSIAVLGSCLFFLSCPLFRTILLLLLFLLFFVFLLFMIIINVAIVIVAVFVGRPTSTTTTFPLAFVLLKLLLDSFACNFFRALFGGTFINKLLEGVVIQ